MFGSKEKIKIKVKLYSGLDRQAGIGDYDSDLGLAIELSRGARLKKLVKILGIDPRGENVFFINGKKAGLSEKLGENDVVFCMKAVSGG